MVPMRARFLRLALASVVIIAALSMTGCATLRSSGAGGAGGVWLWDNPRLVGNDLRAVAFSDGRDGWAVGAHGTIVHTLNAAEYDTVGAPPFTGSQMIQTRAEFSGTYSDLNGIAVALPETSTAFAVGDHGTILRTTNGGRTWLRLSSFTGSDLSDVDAQGPSHAVAVGAAGTIRQWNGTAWLVRSAPTSASLMTVDLVTGALGFAGGTNGTLLKTIDGGAHWTRITNNLPAAAEVRTVSFGSPSVGWATTWSGTEGAIWRTTNGGTTWTKIDAEAGVAIESVSASGTDVAYAAGEHGFVFYTNGSVTTTANAGSMPHLVCTCVSSGTAWAVGENGTVYAGNRGDWGLKSQSVTEERLNGYSGLAQWAIGGSGTILRWSANPFTNAPSVTSLPTTADLTAISFVNSGLTGWITAADGTVFLYTNGSLSGTSSVPVSPTSICATDEANVWLAGNLGPNGYVLASGDGGSTWTTATTYPNVHLQSISAKGDHVYVAGGYAFGSSDAAIAVFDGSTWRQGGWPTQQGLRGICAFTTTGAVAVGENGEMFRTTNGGVQWTAPLSGTSADLNAVSFANEMDGRAVGEHGVAIATSDGGATWTWQDSGATDDLLAVDLSAGPRRAVGARGAALVESLIVTQQLAGGDRYETALDVSRKTWTISGITTSAVLATGENWPDAVSGSSLAGAVNGPMLLTRRTTVPRGLVTELKRLGIDKLYVLGSKSAVDSAVVSSLMTQMGTGFQVVRIAGVDRYETSSLIASATVAEIAAHGGTYDHSAFLSTGLNWPDALAVAPVASHAMEPVLLTRPSGLPASVASACASLGVSSGVVLGSESAVPQGVADEFAAVIGQTPQRWAGADRYATASQIASGGIGQKGLSTMTIALATGANFPDALSGGVAQGRMVGPLLLTPPDYLAPDVATFISGHRPMYLHFIGSTDVLPLRPRNEAAWVVLSGF
jgi:photosystem II stability/assembly factor-like uncharacterized protein